MSVVATAACGGVAQAAASSVYDDLAALNPGTTAAEMQAAVEEEATASGQSPDAIAQEALAEAQAHADEIGRTTAAQTSSTDSMYRSSSSGGGDKNKVLPSARLGDIFWWDSTTDHVGLYRSSTTIVQAPGRGKTVEIKSASSVAAPTRTELMFVATKNGGSTRYAADVRQSVADWAATKRGKPYNSNFAFNKTVDASKYNCSQLVWAAWKKITTVDLDNGPGLGVYPGDIREDDRTHIYRKSL